MFHTKKLVLFFAATACLYQFSTAANEQPNVVYILADDLGSGDLSCYGQVKFQTPNIDKIAKNGMLFTQHYSGSAVCAPARCTLMTGLHTGHAPIRGNAQDPDAIEGQMPMPADTYTVAHHFKAAGYTTGIFGKWGLGSPESTSEPLKMGFDSFYGYNCQSIAHCYYPSFLWHNDKRELLWGNVGTDRTDYAPDLIHEQALTFIRDNKDKPFFCYYAAIQPHADMIAPEEYMQKYRGKFLPEATYSEDYYIDQAECHAAFAAMVNVLDDYVGEILGELEKQGLTQNTIVIFSSDNGAHTAGGHDPDYFQSSRNLRGYKRDLYEGGIRVPFVAQWPGHVEPGSRNDHVSTFWDFLPTVAELTGLPLTAHTDGISFLPSLLGKTGQKEHDHLYWEFHDKAGRLAVRKGKWKGVRYDVQKAPNSPLELYDLSEDPGEKNNIASRHPELVQELDAILKKSHQPSPNPKYNLVQPKKTHREKHN
ncbi:arylsulfatase [Luteolibacter algae]|uniref:Arylsulfatase n=1 Tax=Luteolibacter algae TaxID=454151 RepID=A0ABW5DAJ4_9BACT